MENAASLSTYDVLFCDTLPYRHAEFRVKPGDGIFSKFQVSQAHCHSATDLAKRLPEKIWDVIFLPGNWGLGFAHVRSGPAEGSIALEALLNLDKRRYPRLIVLHGTDDSLGFGTKLRDAGFLIAHVPWDFVEPMKHIRKEIK